MRRRVDGGGPAPSATGDLPDNSTSAVANSGEDLHYRDEREEKTAEVNNDEDLLAVGHFAGGEGESDWFSADAAYNFHLQLAPGGHRFSCPICLRVTQLPIRQDCGHVLCVYCMQQSLSAIGGCPLCQAQQIFKTGKNELALLPTLTSSSETEMQTLGLAYDTSATPDPLNPVRYMGPPSSVVSVFHEDALAPVEQAHSSSNSMSGSTGLDANKTHHELPPNAIDLALQLDNLSDLDDVIDLADLVSSDSDRPSPPVAARTSLSGSFVPGPARRARASPRKKAVSSPARMSSNEADDSKQVPAKSPRSPAGGVGKRKARSRKAKGSDRTAVQMQWGLVETGGTAPEQRYDCGFSIYDSRLIVVGGIVGKLRLNDLHVLDLAEKPAPEWTQPPVSGSLPPSGSLLQIFVIGHFLYVIGGTIDGKFLTELHKLDLSTLAASQSGEWKWEKLEVGGIPPSMRYWYSVTVVQGMAILYGGYGHPQRLSDTFALRFAFGVDSADTEIPTWVELNPRGELPGPSSTHSVCVNKGKMYIFGGYDGKFRRGQLFAFEIVKQEKNIEGRRGQKAKEEAAATMASLLNRASPGCASVSMSRPRASPCRYGCRRRIGCCWFVSLALLFSVAVAKSNSSDASGSAGSGVASWAVGGNASGSVDQPLLGEAEASSDIDTIRIPLELEGGGGSSAVDGLTDGADNAGSSSGDDVAVSPVVTDPLLVLSAVETSSGSIDRASVTVEVDPSASTEPPEEMHGVPSNPTLVNAEAFDGRAAVTWKAPDDDGLDQITAYEIGWFDEEDSVLVGTQRLTAMPASSLTDQNASVAETAVGLVPTSAVVGPLVNGRSYTFKVRAQNVNGFSVWSAKSLAVSPLHPPDLCERLSCSGHGTCFPNYHSDRPASLDTNREKRWLASQEVAVVPTDTNTAVDDQYSLDALCICRPGYSPPDCSAKSSEDAARFAWQVTEWGECDSGCGGGRRSRRAVCFDVTTDQRAPSESFCSDSKKPSLTGICNGIECGSKRVAVKYEVEMSYDEVLFSSTAVDAFELAFTTELAAALQIPRSRLEIAALKRGSIVVFFQILPASRVGEESLNDIVENLQDQLVNSSSTLRSMGTFARRIEPNGVKLSFSIADQTVAGGAEDISIAGLVGTVLVLGFFVSLFSWFLRHRHYRILKEVDARLNSEEGGMQASVAKAHGAGMKRMNIRSMA
ncbi:hypothetical protein BBJ28_00011660 [Nothophytophthora sp. Chile5]|nr:hypothetical protein BBJ28_00011660 [Nothophytophthora sp. Chile5]